MVKVKILYFSRTGTSAALAKALGDRIGAKVYRVADDKNWKGLFGYIKAGFYASTWRETRPEIEIGYEREEDEQLIFVSPVWASNMAPALYTLIQKDDFNQFDLLLTNDGSSPEKAYQKIEEKFGKIPLKACVTKRNNNAEEVLQRFEDKYKQAL